MSSTAFCITQSEVAVHRHHTDGGGDSEHVFALLALLGFQFAPRIPDLKNRRLYSFAKPSAYPALEPLIAGRINVALIRAHWTEILRVAVSIRTGTVTASLIMRQLASYPRQNGIAAALRELGRLERTLFTLDWIEDPELRRDTGRNWATESEMRDLRYAGRIPGHVFVLMPNTIWMRRREVYIGARGLRFARRLRIILPVPGKERLLRT
jgi:Tn3 transposase DDE domain